MSETSKAFSRRSSERWFDRYTQGLGIDIGAGNDPLITPHSVPRRWDKVDGDAMLMEGVPDASYDFVYSSHCLEHVTHAHVAIRNWYRILKPGGNLLLSIPHRDLYEKKPTLPSNWNFEHNTMWLMDRLEPPNTFGILPIIRQELGDAQLLYARVVTTGLRETAAHEHSIGEYSIEVGLRKPGPARYVATPLTTLNFHARFDDWSGHGMASVDLALALIRLEKTLGINLRLFAVSSDFRYGEMSADLKVRLSATPGDPTVVFRTLSTEALSSVNSPSAIYTVWESTRLPESYMAMLRDTPLVIVPSAWLASCLSAQGLSAPLEIVQEGIDPEFYAPVPMPEAGPFTFGTAGNIDSGGVRKGIPRVIEAFKRAFPDDSNVRLKVKVQPCDLVDTDPRIEIDTTHHSDLRDWYASLHLYVSGSACEGWGRHQHEAMAIGRPVAGVAFGGVTEFFNADNSYALSYNLVPGEGVYHGCGLYAVPTVKGMTESMRRARQLDPSELVAKARQAVTSARRFTLDRQAISLVDALRRHNLLAPLLTPL